MNLWSPDVRTVRRMGVRWLLTLLKASKIPGPNLAPMMIRTSWSHSAKSLAAVLARTLQGLTKCFVDSDAFVADSCCKPHCTACHVRTFVVLLSGLWMLHLWHVVAAGLTACFFFVASQPVSLEVVVSSVPLLAPFLWILQCGALYYFTLLLSTVLLPLLQSHRGSERGSTLPHSSDPSSRSWHREPSGVVRYHDYD